LAKLGKGFKARLLKEGRKVNWAFNSIIKPNFKAWVKKGIFLPNSLD